MTMSTLSDKLKRMEDSLKEMRSVLVAYSGGIDSTLVLKVAHDCLGPQAVGVTAVSPTFPDRELEQSKRVVEEIGARHVVVRTDQLKIPEFVRNEADRCFHCKTDLYQLIGRLQREFQAAAMADGTNLDDLEDDRPGLQAARQWGVRSPLVEAGLSKLEVRTLAKELGLPNWDKPAAACLSSRIPRGTMITVEKLTRVERAEAVLFTEGFGQFRVRDHGDFARLELDEQGLALIQDSRRRERISRRLKELGFRFVTVDLEGYRAGGANTADARQRP